VKPLSRSAPGFDQQVTLIARAILNQFTEPHLACDTAYKTSQTNSE